MKNNYSLSHVISVGICALLLTGCNGTNSVFTNPITNSAAGSTIQGSTSQGQLSLLSFQRLPTSQGIGVIVPLGECMGFFVSISGSHGAFNATLAQSGDVQFYSDPTCSSSISEVSFTSSESSVAFYLNDAVVETAMISASSSQHGSASFSIEFIQASPSPSPSPTVTVTPTPSPSPSKTVTPSPSPSPSKTVTPSPSPSPSKTVTPSPSPSPTVTVTPTPTPSSSSTSGAYSLPNINSGCPGNCRQIQWQAGSDLWNGGTLPVYPSVTCTGLAANGTTDDSAAIQTCINNAAANTAVYLPAATYFVNNTIRLKSNVVLRGAGPTTQIHLGANGTLTTQNFDYDFISGNQGYAVFPSTYTLSGTPTKGDTTLTIGSGTVSVGTWIKVFGNDDPSLINATGTDGLCQWCGDATGWYVQQQMVQVTAINSGTGGPGSVVTISRPLYYTPYTASITVQGKVEPAGAKYNIIPFLTEKAGYEYFHVTATQDIGATQIILLQGALYCWVKGVETQNTGSSSGSAHIELDFTYGAEIRDNYVHDQRSGASGSGYGIYFQFVSSDAKVENNIMRHNRHSFVFQGGGSGVAMLYNYMDDMYTDDTTYLGSARTSHGAHPFMDLFEGNVASHITADDFWGTSSHDVFFRNWLWGDETENWSGAVAPTGTPNNGFDAVDLFQSQEYYSYVGNVLGHTGLHANWAAGILSVENGTNSCGYEEVGAPGVYSYGDVGLGTAAQSSSTVLRHGNWDYKTNGVAFWDGGANHTLPASMYYANQPSFLSGYAWPLEGPEGAPTINTNAAENCYLSGPGAGGSFNPAVCYGSN